MKLFVINLDRQPERLRRMARMLEGMGLSFSRVSAVDGAQLSEEAIGRWCGHASFGAMRPGAVACFLSHRECWRRVVDEGLPLAAVFEDDLHMADDAASLLANGDWVPEETDIVKLETMRQPTRVDKSPFAVVGARRLHRLAGKHVGAGGYIVTRKGAEKLLAMSQTFNCPVDHFIFNPEQPSASSLETLQLCPAICIQDFFLKDPAAVIGLGSDLHEERSQDRPRGLMKLWREAKRPSVQLANLVQRMASTWLTDKKWIVVDFR
ncbi:glycosyltransferase family 25 protein [Chelativorans sp.]|uniref:glycosyltransferase family 25 protein n=1 Tax=Chelativorans sp. TaxID=2203393 RepID=UPI002812377A|nr:glycosyltransferase family 25 protein [Chelativorans sp.]